MPDIIRGQHAHKTLKQAFIALTGKMKIRLEKGNQIEIHELEAGNGILLEEQMIWRELYEFTSDAVLIVIVDKEFDEDDYIRDKNQFNVMLELQIK